MTPNPTPEKPLPAYRSSQRAVAGNWAPLGEDSASSMSNRALRTLPIMGRVCCPLPEASTLPAAGARVFPGLWQGAQGPSMFCGWCLGLCRAEGCGSRSAAPCPTPAPCLQQAPGCFQDRGRPAGGAGLCAERAAQQAGLLPLSQRQHFACRRRQGLKRPAWGLGSLAVAPGGTVKSCVKLRAQDPGLLPHSGCQHLAVPAVACSKFHLEQGPDLQTLNPRLVRHACFDMSQSRPVKPAGCLAAGCLRR